MTLYTTGDSDVNRMLRVLQADREMLLAAAHLVIATWETGNLAESVRELNKVVMIVEEGEDLL